MNKKRTYKVKLLKLFWTHIFVIISLLYFVSSDLNDLSPARKNDENDGVSLQKIKSEQNMCTDDNCNQQNKDKENPESLNLLQANNEKYGNETEETLEEDLEHPDDQMTSDITGIITTTEKFISATETTVRPTHPRPAKHKSTQNARR